MRNMILLFLLSVLMVSCQEKQKTKHEGDCCKKPKQAEVANYDPDVSVFDVTSTWFTQDERQVQLKDIRAKAIVAAMIFTNCASACPRITADLKRIEEALPKDKREQVAFVLISMDPDRDTPQRLREFAAEHQLDLSRWTLLTATEPDVLEISSVLNVRIKQLNDGSFDHSNIIHVLNDKGNIVHQQVGLAVDPAASVQAVLSLL